MDWPYYYRGELERGNSHAESDILNPEELQDVMNETGNLMDCVLHSPDALYSQPYDPTEISESKYSPQGLPPLADSTFMHDFSKATGPLPARDDYSGAFNFSVLLDGIESTKNKWTYSRMLNKLYIVVEKIIPIQFKWSPTERNFVVRALPVYTDAQDMKEPVKRCFIHVNPKDPSNEGFEHVKHIIRSDNPGAYYEENPKTERCSVVVPLGELQPGTGTVTVTYKFMCKTTCVKGLNRRPITVLFTLERPNGEVVGRQKLNVKICSCPKRDMQKDEMTANAKDEESSKKRPLALTPTPKRLKIEEDDDFSINMQVTDRDLYKSMLEGLQGVLLRFSRNGPKSHPRCREADRLLRDIDSKLEFVNS